MSTTKRKRKANGGPILSGFGAPMMPVQDMGGVDIMMMADGDASGMPKVDPLAGMVSIPLDDGSVEINFGGPEILPRGDAKFDDNLAEDLDDAVLSRIAQDLLESIEQDEHDRSGWITERAEGLPLLGLKVEQPGGGGNVGSASTAVPGQSTVRDGLLGEACDRFQANAFAELCPSEGPCKAVNYGTETNDNDNLAAELEKDFNYYLTSIAKEYYPDTRKMLFMTGYASGMFKKVYRCPLRNRPVSESVDGADLIVPSNATDLHNAGRVTHQINMRQSVMRRMQILGVYRDVKLTAPTPQPNALKTKEADVIGMAAKPQLEADQDYTVYECYTELDLPGFEHKKRGEETGLPLPYRVSIDKDSRTILEIRRNWEEPEEKPTVEGKVDTKAIGHNGGPGLEDDDDVLPIAKIPFVLFPYATGLGFYGTGLLHRLGNYSMALTAMLRESIDAGMFASFPGFLYAKPMGRQLQNEFRVPPGGGMPIDVSAVGGNINNAVMALPYKDVSPALVQLQGNVRQTAEKWGGAADMPVGEGVANAPVGSVLAAIEQATKIEGGVHKALHAAQKEELQLLKELFRDDPEALWRGNKRPAMGVDHATRLAKFKMALENCEIVPASDPNVPSNMHRLAKGQTLSQMNMQMPGIFDPHKLAIRLGTMNKIEDIESLFADAPQPQQPDPIAMAALQAKAKEVENQNLKIQLDNQKADKDRDSRESIEAAKLAAEHAQAMQPTEQPSPEQPETTDPLQIMALQLKKQQVDQSGHKMLLDAHTAHLDREAQITTKAMDIASRLATHPEAQPVVNSELQGMSAYLTPPQPSMAAGGKVDKEDDEVTRIFNELTVGPHEGPRRLHPDVMAEILKAYQPKGTAS